MKNPSCTTRASLTRTALHAAGLLAGTAALHAADIQWTGTTGSYFSPADWSTGTVPGPNDFAWVGNGGTVQIATGSPQMTTQDFRTGAGGTAGAMEQSGGIANITSWFRMGVDLDSTGSYTMSGGMLNIRNNRMNIGEKGAGTFTLSGGLVVHHAGQLIIGDRNVGGAQSSATSTGVFNQSGGTITNESEVWVGFGADGDNASDFGTLNVTGGTFNVRRWFVVGRTGGDGVVNISGADTLVAKSGEDGALILGDAAGAANSKGTVHHNSGTLAVGSEGWIGQSGDVAQPSSGTYNFNGGSINVNNIWAVGRSRGSGVFNMTGGTLTKTGGGSFVVAREGSPSGVVNHSGGLVNIVDGELHIGEGTATIPTGVGSYTLSGTGEVKTTAISVSRGNTAQGTLNLDGGTARIGRIYRNATDPLATGVVNFNGTQIVATSFQTAFINALTTADVKSGGLKVDSDSYELTTAQAFTGTGGLTKSGRGSLTLDGNFGASGASTVSGGTLAVNDAFAGSLTLSDGGTLTGDEGTVAGTTTVAASGGALAVKASAITPLHFTGDVTLNGPTRIDATDALLSSGSYTVATYAGALNHNGNFVLSRPGSVDLSTPGTIKVVVGAARTLTWTGAANSTWDIFSTQNWDNSGSGAAFGQGDTITFTDVAGAAPISVTGPVKPDSLTFDNTAGNTITVQAANPTAEVTGFLTLTKQGAGKAILDVDATGAAVEIVAGELQVGNGGTNGFLGSAPIINDGTLHINLSRDRVFNNTITGSGTGNFVKSGTGNVTLNNTFFNPGTTTVNGGRLTLVTPAILTGTGTTIASGAELEVRSTANHDAYTGVLGGAGKLIKTGGSELFLNADNSAFTGEIELRRGPTNSLNIRNAKALGSPAGKTVVHGLNGTNSQQLNIRNLGAGSPFTIAEPIELRANAFGRAGITHEAGTDSTQTVNLTGPIGVYSTGRSAINLLRNYNRTGTVNFLGEITGRMGGANLFLRGNVNASTGSINILGGLNIEDDAELTVTEDVRVRFGAAGKTYSGFRTTIANGHLRTLVNNALPTDQQLFLGEGNNAVDSKLILGEGANAVQQTIAGLGANNTDPDCRIVGGASTNSTLTMNLSGNVTFTRPFGGGGTNENNLQLVKSGVGTLTLSTNNSTHTGTTTVNGGALLVNSTITSSPFIAAAGGTIGGTGTTGTISIAGSPSSRARLAPGNATIGTLSAFGTVTLGADSAYDWEVNDWNGSAGSNYDTLNAASLSITATSANPVQVKVASLNGPANFVEENRTFTLVQSAGGITGFAADKFVFDTTGFPGTGTWAARQDGNNLVIDYTAGITGDYSTWAAENAVTGGPDGDSDFDGIPNLVEYALNLNSAGSDGSAGTYAGGTVTFAKRDVAVENGDVTYVIQTSETLAAGSWTDVPGSDPALTDNATTISYVLPTGETKIFVRLVIAQVP